MKINYTTKEINGVKESVMVTNISQKEALSFGLEAKKGNKPFCVVFGSNEIYRGFGYTIEEAINNSKKVD
jgi:hypothetical protein